MNNINRRDKIIDEIIVDCYDGYEVSMGWYYYLEDSLTFPFDALVNGDKVVVIALTNSDKDNVHIENFVATVKVQKDENSYDVPLKNIKVMGYDNETLEAIENWNYWCDDF